MARYPVLPTQHWVITNGARTWCANRGWLSEFDRGQPSLYPTYAAAATTRMLLLMRTPGAVLEIYPRVGRG